MNIRRLIILTLSIILIGGVCFLYFTYNPTEHSFFVPCPLKYTTGIECPGCGSQRAIHQLLHGNIATAFGLNPLLIISLPLLIYGLGLKVHNYIYDTQHRFMLFYHKWFVYGYFGLVVVYWIARNIPYYPFTLLSSDG
ncbi:hypothetical protein SCB49_06782 [unidentified eubacterium SCB49]|nr:hypothetical protein SCB49_06782 [unidentified eubacterium SCB49]